MGERTQPPDREQRPNRDAVSDASGAIPAGDTQRPNRPERRRELGAVPGRWREREVGRLAARQRGLITYEQLRELGISTSAITRAVQRARLFRVHRRVYAAIDPIALPPLAREQAALLACGTGSVLSHVSAAVAWGMTSEAPARVDVMAVGHERGRKEPGIRLHTTTDLPATDIRRRHALTLTSPARTLLDLAAILPARELERIFDAAVANRIVSRTAIRELLERHPGRPGSAALRDLLESNTLSRSTGEKELLTLIMRAGLPMPETNARFDRFEVDFLWREERVAVELDGYEFHSSRAALERDHAKDRALRIAGVEVIRVTGRELARTRELVQTWIVAAVTRGEGQSSTA